MNQDDIRYTVETLNFTKGLPHALQAKFVRIIAKTSKAETIRPMTPLFKEGETEGDEGFILLDGEISIRSSQKGEFSVWGPELIGETKQFNPNNIRTANVETVSDCKVLRFEWDDFWTYARGMLSEEEVAQLKESVSNYAWEHFSG
jgi:CRP-like cAMP-binding protein